MVCSRSGACAGLANHHYLGGTHLLLLSVSRNTDRKKQSVSEYVRLVVP
jgi:hypothetical protein